MSQILDNPIPSSLAHDANIPARERKRKNIIWSWAYVAVCLLLFIFNIFFLTSYRASEEKSAPYFLAALIISFVPNLVMGMIVWLAAWPFMRRKLKWYVLAMYSTIFGCALLGLFIFKEVLRYMYAR